MQTRTLKKLRPETIRKRTPAQLEAAARLNEQNVFPGTRDKDGELVMAPAGSSESWWTRAKTREEFDRIAAEQRPRLTQSPFGRSRTGQVME